MNEVRQRAERWLAAEPDEDLRDELAALLAGGDARHDELDDRFRGRLEFGTAGLRAEVGAGPMRMNRLVVRQAAAGLGSFLRDVEQRVADGTMDADLLRLVADPYGGERIAERGVVIAYDARRKSDVFALDTARVLAAKGVRARLLPSPLPTPVLAWSISHLGAAAGVMVTASHNPPADNGYKVYLGTGSQIVAPIDAEISRWIGAADPLDLAIAPEDHPLIVRLDGAVRDAYLASVSGVRLRPEVPGVPVAYTAMHGVGGDTAVAAFEAAGFPPPACVDEQFQPDPSFPTVPFPNPEEPGAMDLLIALADRSGAAVALAHDPDADRLGVAIPQPGGSWRRLGGDEIGWLFADHILSHTAGDDRLVVTTLVSSSLLRDMAAAHGVQHAETYTGFKWIARTVLERPDQRFVFGYEQALGYLVTSQPLDKDGITAAVMMAEIAAVAHAEGSSLQDRLDSIAERFGRHEIAERSVRMAPADAARSVAALEAAPPAEVNGVHVESMETFPDAGLVRLVLSGGVRLQVRPSGTEPKVKLYGEAVGIDPAPFLDALAIQLSALAGD